MSPFSILLSLLGLCLLSPVIDAAPSGELVSRKQKLHKWPTPKPLSDELINNVKCHPKPTGAFHDTHEDKVIWAAHYFCREISIEYPHARNDRPIAPFGRYYDAAFAYRDSWHGDFLEGVYALNITDEGLGCKAETVDMMSPTGRDGPTDLSTGICESVVWGTYKYCYNNRGMGGSLVVGCLKYEFTPLQIWSSKDLPRQYFTDMVQRYGGGTGPGSQSPHADIQNNYDFPTDGNDIGNHYIVF